VRLRQLRLQNLRAFEAVEVDLDARWNVFVGPNGAGKTTLLEAAYLLSHARSFRGGPKDALVRRGAAGYSVFGSVGTSGGVLRALGLARVAGGFEARVDGAPATIAELIANAAVVCFEPGSHELISGAAEGRRRFLDWGVFHVEHGFLATWRAFHRALRQRNALLRLGCRSEDLDPWDRELARSGADLVAMRERYAGRFAPIVAETLGGLLPELGPARFVLDPGWAGDAEALDQLGATRDDDLRRGFTTRGPHRTDWSITFEGAPRREHLSRGQEKLCALGCALAQAREFAASRGEWPIVCIDDLASELDAPHQETLVATLRAVDAQILVTGTHEPAAISAAIPHAARFHVEPGRVARLL